jgi:ElaB/YqjD/DUF883 family membrane-anchored ribosome-binding protein
MSNKTMGSRFDSRLDSLKESVRGLVESGGDRAAALKDRMKDVKDSALEGAGTAANRLGKLIKAHPIAAIAIAFGVGYVAMRIVRRR